MSSGTWRRALGVTETLSRFVAEISPRDVPERIMERAKLHLLDSIGASIYGSQLEWSRLVRETVAQADGICTVIGGSHSTPQAACLVNGTSGHSFELDDIHDESGVHPGTVVVPAALAAAEVSGSSGRELLTAVVAGYEIMCRIGLEVDLIPHLERGFHPTGTNGAFGAAAAAATLMRFNSDQVQHVMGVAASMAAGLMQFTQTGGMIKRLHAGRAAEAGILAAMLVKKGFTGPAQVLEGTCGYYNAYSGAPDLGRATEALGERFVLEEVSLKPYCCCSNIFPVVDAVLQIKREHHLQPEAVESIEAEVSKPSLTLNGGKRVESMIEAQFSIAFNAAFSLVHDIEVPKAYNEQAWKDARLRALMQKVDVKSTEEFDRIYPRELAARVRIRHRDGRTFEATVHSAKGTPKNPMTPGEVERKFRFFTDFFPQARPVPGIVSTLDAASSIAPLMECLAAGTSMPARASA